jgi:hypothetical protein
MKVIYVPQPLLPQICWSGFSLLHCHNSWSYFYLFFNANEGNSLQGRGLGHILVSLHCKGGWPSSLGPND